MYSDFKYQTIPLKDIVLDDRNPRIVTPTKLTSQEQILQYLFEYEELDIFIKKIAVEGKNVGAERPYVVKDGTKYTVVEGNTRIAAYQSLTGILQPPKKFATAVPQISDQLNKSLLNVDCSIAPNRDALLPIMANAHFGQGDKSRWGYLGSRKAVYDEWRAGRSVPELATAFDRTESQIRELILEYMLYQKSLKLDWSKAEKEKLQRPGIQFNPPVRFLQTSGHKAKLGVTYDTTNIKVVFADQEAERKFKHLLKKLVVEPVKGLGATATWEQVFGDYAGTAPSGTSTHTVDPTGNSASSKSTGAGGSGPQSSTMPAAQSDHDTHGGAEATSETQSAAPTVKLKSGALFAYSVTVNNALIAQLMKEAKEINCKKLPGAGTFLLRNIVEALLKQIIDQQKANPASNMLDLEKSINLCMSDKVALSAEDKKILKEFSKNYVSYLNLGAHGNVIPNVDRLMGARDCIDQFVRKNI
jgi:hypothetical protein